MVNNGIYFLASLHKKFPCKCLLRNMQGIALVSRNKGAKNAGQSGPDQPRPAPPRTAWTRSARPPPAPPRPTQPRLAPPSGCRGFGVDNLVDIGIRSFCACGGTFRRRVFGSLERSRKDCSLSAHCNWRPVCLNPPCQSAACSDATRLW